MNEKSLGKLHLGLRMTALILVVTVLLSAVALIIAVRLFSRKKLEKYKEVTHNIGSSVELLMDDEEMMALIEDVREVYLNAPAELRDYDAKEEGKAPHAERDGAYAALFNEIKASDSYKELTVQLNRMANKNDAVDIYIWFPDLENHRMVCVCCGTAEEFREDAEDPGFWIKMFEIEEASVRNPDPNGVYEKYEGMRESNGKWVSVFFVQCILPIFSDETYEKEANAFVSVDVEYEDITSQTMVYLKTYLFYVGILTILLTILSQLVLRFFIVKPLQKVTAEQERIATELSLAANIQSSLLPVGKETEFGHEGLVKVYGTMDPAKETSGDFFDYFTVDEDHLLLMIADVSGKGVPAAMFMMMSKIFIDSYATTGLLPGDALAKANDAVCARNSEHMFVTVWLGLLEISTGRLVASNAGHEEPAIRRAGGRFEIYNDPHGLVVGGLEGMPYDTYEVIMGKGDTFFIYTDGLPEATDGNGVMYKEERMIDALNELPLDADPEMVCKHMKAAVDDFVGTAPQFDDLTMLCVSIDANG